MRKKNNLKKETKGGKNKTTEQKAHGRNKCVRNPLKIQT